MTDLERMELRALSAEMAIGMALAHPEAWEDVLRAHVELRAAEVSR